MTTPDDRSAPFTASDEAFFQAGLTPARELPSERPVTLDAGDDTPDEAGSDVPDEARTNVGNAARRARFVRPVRSTLLALSVLATVGAWRHVWHAESVELRADTSTFVPAAAHDVTATGAPAELETDIVAAHETDDTDTPLLTLSTCDDCSSGETQGETPSPPVSEAPLFGPPPPAELSAPAHGAASAVAERSADHRKAKLVVRNPSQHAARPPHPNRRSAPLNKAALLRALRSS